MKAEHKEWSMLPLVRKAHLPWADVPFFVANFYTFKGSSSALIFSLGYKKRECQLIILSADTIFSKSQVITIVLLWQINCAYIFLKVQWPKPIQYFNLTRQNRAEGSAAHNLPITPLFIHTNTYTHLFFLKKMALLTLT